MPKRKKKEKADTHWRKKCENDENALGVLVHALDLMLR